MGVPGGRVASQARLQPGKRGAQWARAGRTAAGTAHTAAHTAGDAAVDVAEDAACAGHSPPNRQAGAPTVGDAPPAQPAALLLPQLLRCFHCLKHGLACEGKVDNVAGRAARSRRAAASRRGAASAAAAHASASIAGASSDDLPKYVVQHARGQVKQAHACSRLRLGLRLSWRLGHPSLASLSRK